MLKIIVAAQVFAHNALRDRKGVSSLEYGVIAAAVIGAVVAAGTVLSDAIGTAFGTLATKITTAF